MPCAELRGRAGLLLVAAAVPALCDLTRLELAAWTGAVLLGAGLGARHAAGAVGLGWIAAILVPGTPPASVAASSMLGADAPFAAGAASLVGAIFAWAAPDALAQPGILLLAAGFAAAALQAWRKP